MPRDQCEVSEPLQEIAGRYGEEKLYFQVLQSHASQNVVNALQRGDNETNLLLRRFTGRCTSLIPLIQRGGREEAFSPPFMVPFITSPDK